MGRWVSGSMAKSLSGGVGCARRGSVRRLGLGLHLHAAAAGIFAGGAIARSVTRSSRGALRALSASRSAAASSTSASALPPAARTEITLSPRTRGLWAGLGTRNWLLPRFRHLWLRRRWRGFRRRWRLPKIIGIRRLQRGDLGVLGLPNLAGGFRIGCRALAFAAKPFCHAALVTQKRLLSNLGKSFHHGDTEAQRRTTARKTRNPEGHEGNGKFPNP